MKKRLIPILLFFLILFSNTIMPASARSLSIPELNIQAEVLPNGDMRVREEITFKFSGQYNGVFYNIDAKGLDGLSDYDVMILSDSGTEYMNESSSGQAKTYDLSIEDGMYNFKLYLPSENEKKTIVFEYTLLNIVTSYSDSAELYRTFIGEDEENRIENLNIDIILPEGASKDEILVFAHGPLHGDIEKVSANKVNLSITELDPGYFVEARILFPNTLVPESQNKLARSNLDTALAEEESLAHEANEIRSQAKRSYKNAMLKVQIRVAITAITVLGVVLWFLIIRHIHIKYGKEYDVAFSEKYVRDLPGEYSPAEMSSLINFGKVQPNDIVACLMDLVARNQLDIEVIQFEVKKLFKTSEEEDYMFVLSKNYDESKLVKHEKFLVDWLFKQIGDDESVTLEQINNYSSSKSKAEIFLDNFNTWSGMIEISTIDRGFFEKEASKGKKIGATVSLIYFVSAILIGFVFFISVFCAVIFIILSIIGLIFTAGIARRTYNGQEEYLKWMAMKRFLKDFSSLKEATIPSLIIWEKYLVYAISLGVAKEVIDQIDIVLRTESMSSYDNYRFSSFYMYSRGIHSMRSFSTIGVSKIETSFTNAQRRISASSSSSGSGGGGGFSGGGGGGGGGSSSSGGGSSRGGF